MDDFKDISIRMLEILDKMFEDSCYASELVRAEYTWRYDGAKYAFEELLCQEIGYDTNDGHHVIL